MSGQLALTVRQPWASQIITGAKDIEYRSWRPRHRGRVWIHSALRQAESGGENLPRGVILGSVTLIGILGGAKSGVFAWHLANPRQLAEPVQVRGLPGLWPVPDEVLAKLLDTETNKPAR